MLIAFAGLPSSGKSSTASALATLLNVESFLEPEEVEWSNLIRSRETTGKFTALTWFRGARLPGLIRAKEISDNGGTAIVDSYYDKLVALYMKQSCFSWLIPCHDPYFDVAFQMAKLDLELLPSADILVFLRLNEQTWLKLMEHRGRDFDRTADLRHHFEMQRHIEQACIHIAQMQDTRLIIIDQKWSCPDDTANLILQQLDQV